MLVYKLNQDKITNYHGCGKAWAAIKDGEVLAVRYFDRSMNRYDSREELSTCPLEQADCPEWVRAVCGVQLLFDRDCLRYVSSKRLSEIKAAAIACYDCPVPPRRAEYRPKELLEMAVAEYHKIENRLFGEYREKMRAELATLGTVVSGMLSCWELCIDDYKAEQAGLI